MRLQPTRLMQCQRKLKSPKSREVVAKLLSLFRGFVDDRETAAEDNWHTDESKCIGLTHMSMVVWCGLADLDESMVSTLGYIEGYMKGQRYLAIIIDTGLTGLTVDLINA